MMMEPELTKSRRPSSFSVRWPLVSGRFHAFISVEWNTVGPFAYVLSSRPSACNPPQVGPPLA
jgi:hypothetical protein